MAIRNISVVISANVRKYTDGLRTAATATKNFQKQVSTSGQVVASSSRSVRQAAREHTLYEKSLHASTRAGGMALAQTNRLSAATRNGNRALAAASSQTGAWAKSAMFLKTAAAQAVGAMAGFTLINGVIRGVQAAFSFLVSSVIEFDDAITKSLAIAEEFGPGVRKQFEEAARAQSKLSSFSPAELATGYEALLQAGLDTQTSIEATAVVANFAQAGVMDLGKASDMAAQATAALGLATGDTNERVANMARVTDVLVVAAVKSTASVEDFGEALTNKFGTGLSLANKTVEEGTAILMAYARVGIKGKTAGTQAAIFLRDIQKAAIDNGDALKDMGVNVYDAEGNINDLVTIAKQMNAAFGSMDSKNLRVTLRQLGFADRAVHSILPIIATGADTWDEYYEATRDAGGASAKIAARQLESISNRIKLVQQGLSTLAEKAGRGALNALYKGWVRIKEPIDAIYQNVQKIGKSIVEAVKPAATIVGGAFYGALQLTLQTLKGITNVLAALGPALTPLMSVAATAVVLSKGMAMLSAAFGTNAAAATASAAATGTAATANTAAAASAYGAAMAHNAAAAAAAAHRSMTISAAFSSAAAWVKSNLTISASFAGAAAAAKSFGAAAYAAALKMAPMLAIAAIATLIMKYRQLNEEADAAGGAIAQSISEKYSMDSFEDRAKAVEEQRKAVNDLREAYDNGAGEAGGFFGSIQSFFNNNYGSRAIDEARAQSEKLAEENKKLGEGIQAVADKSGVSFETAAKRIEAAGLTETFITASKDSKEYKEAVDQSASSLANVGSIAASTGTDVEAMARLSDDALAGMQEEADELQDKFREVMGSLFDPEQVMSDIVAVNDAIASGFGGSLSSVREGIQSDLEAAAQEASENSMDSFNKGIEAQIDALKKQKEDLDPPRGKKTSNAEKDRIDERKEAIDAEIDALQDGKKAKEDFEAATPTISMGQFLTGLQKSAEEAQKFSSSLLALRDKLRATGMDEEMVSAIVTQFAEMGPEALPLIDEFATATGDKFTAMATQVQESIKALNPEIKVTLNDLIAQQKAGVEKLRTMTTSLLDFNDQMNFDGGISIDQIKQFAALGPEYAAMVPDMVAQIKNAGPPGSAAAQQTATDIANVVKTQLQLADYGAGVIPDAITNAMEQARTIANTDASKITDAMRIGMIENRDALNAATSMLGVDLGSQMWDSMVMGLAAKGDPFVAGLLMIQQTVAANRAAVNKDANGNWTHNGKPIEGPIGKADGGIVQFANGGMWKPGKKFENHKPQIAKAGQMRVWAEPETGGEAYIPLGQNKRRMALPVLAEVARRFGYQMENYANGGVAAAPGAPMVGGGQWGTPAAVQIIPVPVPVQSKNEFNFGDIQGVKMEDAEAYANRKRRQQRLAGGRR